jgi:hypothetical protein
MITNREEGSLGDAGAHAAATHLAAQQTPHITPQEHPPTQIAQDNLGVVNTVNNICFNHKALMPLSRMVNHIRGLVAAKIILPIKVPAAQMSSDGLTKPTISPTLVWTKAAPILGAHPALTAIQHRVALKYNKRLTLSERQELTAETEINKEPLMAMAAVGICHDQPPWLSHTRRAIRDMLQRMGFTHSLPKISPPSTTAEHHPTQEQYQQEGRCAVAAAAVPVLEQDAQQEEEVCLAEALRRALMKLNPEERLLFSTRWRGTAMGDTITQAMASGVSPTSPATATPIPLAQPWFANNYWASSAPTPPQSTKEKNKSSRRRNRGPAHALRRKARWHKATA